MIGALVDLGRQLVPREPPLVVCLVLFAMLVTVLVGWFAFLLGRYGGVSSWPRPHGLALAAVAIAGSVCWLWVDGPVEGRVLLGLSARHGITDGDLMIVPAVAAAMLALVGQVRYRQTT